MKRVLVTGSGGFIGRHAAACLKQLGYEIHAPKSSELDLMNAAQVTQYISNLKPGYLLHLAWYAEHGKFWTSPTNLDWVTASIHLFKGFIEQGGQRAVVAGSCAEYDWTHETLIEDSTPSNPRTLYGICKNSLRQMLAPYATQSSVTLAWPRIFFLYGPGESPNRFVPSVMNAIRDGKPPVVRSGGHVRQLMHVEDVAGALVAVLDSTIEGIVNVAGNEAKTLGEVATLLAQMFGGNVQPQLANAAGTADNPKILIADTMKLRSIGFSAKYGLMSGLSSLR